MNTPTPTPGLEWFATRVAAWLIIGAALVVLAGWHGGIPTVPHIQRPLPPAPAVSADLADEIWWTTTDCPEGEAIPCLDPAAFADAEQLPPTDIYVIEPGDVSDAMWDALIARGYRGDAADEADEAERLYVPLADAMRECRTDRDCTNVDDAMADARYGA